MAGSLIAGILLDVLNGEQLRDAIAARLEAGALGRRGRSLAGWVEAPDDWVIGRRIGAACYIDDALPAILYLALKYHDDPERALVVNTNLGGDNAGRGAVPGALLGASLGLGCFPARWVEGLVSPPPELLAG